MFARLNRLIDELSQLTHIALGMSQQQITVVHHRSFNTGQGNVNTRSQQLIFYGVKSLRTLWMTCAHVVRTTIWVGKVGCRHLAQPVCNRPCLHLVAG